MSAANYLLLLLVAAYVPSVNAEEVYVVAATTAPVVTTPPCIVSYWQSDLHFHNTGTSDAVVHFLGISNGSATPPLDITVPAGRTSAVQGGSSMLGPGVGWVPDSHDPVWMVHLDVPDTVVLENRAEVVSGPWVPCNPGQGTILGGLPLPSFRSLVSAGTPQYHLQSDLGNQDYHMNVTVFNSGSVPAQATLSFRQGCDDGLEDESTVTIPPNSLEVFGGFTVYPNCSEIPPGAANSASYVVVTVDQDSVSYVTTLLNGVAPEIPIGISFVQ